METLLDLFSTTLRLGKREAALWSDGYRIRKLTYSELHRQVEAFARYLELRNIRKGQRVMIWSENRPEWVAAFWACVSLGVEVVPVDFRFSPDLVGRILVESRTDLVIAGDQVNAATLNSPIFNLREAGDLPDGNPTAAIHISPEDVVEIVYTSGTTGEPKGVIHRHRNICANLRPFQKEISRYSKWARPFQPVRILDLLPLSHMFGQSQGLFIPLLLEGSVAFMNDLHSAAIIRAVHDHHISAVVSVPRILENLRSETERRFHLPEPISVKGLPGVAMKWWRYRKVHSRFGWKFWAFIVGGARVDPELEEFWGRLGFLVVQGYGLTETSPVVAVNHPFNTRKGSLGKVVAGQDVMIAADGEILVRGESVIVPAGEWLHTGDLGEIDREGRLYYRGRKKDLIVTPEGLNVHPEDVERILNDITGVKESAVVPVNEQVHAVLILRTPTANVEEIIRDANARLEAHQRIRHWSIWKEADFPRTASTLKLKRHEVAATLLTLEEPREESERSAPVQLENLSSLERVELLSEIEDRHGVELDENAFSKLTTTAELEAWMRNPQPATRDVRVSKWPRRAPVRWARTAFQHLVMFPLFHHYMTLTVFGIHNLDAVNPPVIFAANHTSHLDTIAIYAALPLYWRQRLAPAMMQEHFRAFFEKHGLFRKDVWSAGLQYMLARGIFNAYPLPQQMSGVRRALDYTGELVRHGYCPLVYPEGTRTPDGSLLPFRPGIGMMAVKLGLPVIPIRLEGLFEILPMHQEWPKRGPIRVTIGEPLKFAPDMDYQAAAHHIENALRRL